MRVKAVWGSVAAFGALVLTVPVSADTVVKKDGSVYRPELAKSWTGEGTVVKFVLNNNVDGTKLAQSVSEHLNGAKASFDQGQMTVTGLPMATVLDQLAELDVGTDPLAELGGFGGATAHAASQEGGSIRAARGVGMPEDAQGALGEPDSHTRLRAQVVEVHRGAFPQVTLKLKILQTSQTGTLSQELKKGRLVDAVVHFSGAQVDMQHAGNQRNLAAYYLAAGDKINLHAVPDVDGKFDRLSIDWLERL